MRKARNCSYWEMAASLALHGAWFALEFHPSSVDDIMKIVMELGSDANRYFRMVTNASNIRRCTSDHATLRSASRRRFIPRYAGRNVFHYGQAPPLSGRHA